ncbi:MAG: hypothetical protein SFV18_04080 [Bryobacteraceae bacterium]|nr:hypothetical protein [Bryobacteraceae bacterium]
MPMPSYEKLGAFYLGRRTDNGETLLYDSKDLVTHAVCVGMTGSGKTGLCIGLLEEAAIDGIPALVIDPKGDIANLLLAFPELDAASFEPWVNPDEARAQGMEPPAFATAQAELWKKGLAKWDQDGERIARMKAAAEFTVYTPGSDAGVPVSVLKSFGAPDEAMRDDREAMRDRISANATSLLGLLGIDADPVQSREHILISTLLDNAWGEGEDVDLGMMISRIQQPPVTKIGVMDVDSFYPAKERFALSMQLNNLLASPGFEAWMQGDALDIGNLLYTPAGKPRIAIFSIAHLSDAERMFFVSLLLNQTLAWVRTQSGTTSLRALLYMDEIFGYFPPVANPPSKKPLLTLLKQARAYGFGVVLATQNPVDLDYKGLANTGTWFIGRLQTERDKARVMEGLEGAAQASGGAFDKQKMEQLLAGLGKRVFLMNNVHESEPVLFETRWCLSYLRGPLSRAQIKRLSQERPASAPAATKPMSSGAPVLPPEIAPLYDPRATDYEARLYGLAEVHFLDDKKGVDETRTLAFTTPFRDDALVVNWADAEQSEDEFEKTPADAASFADLPAPATKPKNYATWSKDFAAWLFRTQSVELYRSASLKLTSAPGESERDFRIRLTQAAREERDAIAEKLRAKYAPKIAVLEERKRKAAQTVEREKQQAQDQTFGAILNAGTSILGAFLGRKGSAMGKLSTAARSATRVAKERGDVSRATETVEAIDAQMQDLNAQFESDVAALGSTIDPATEVLETISVRPKKTNISVKLVTLAWVGR